MSHHFLLHCRGRCVIFSVGETFALTCGEIVRDQLVPGTGYERQLTFGWYESCSALGIMLGGTYVGVFLMNAPIDPHVSWCVFAGLSGILALLLTHRITVSQPLEMDFDEKGDNTMNVRIIIGNVDCEAQVGEPERLGRFGSESPPRSLPAD